MDKELRLYRQEQGTPVPSPTYASHFILTTTPGGRWYDFLFRGEKTEIQRAQGMYPKTMSNGKATFILYYIH